MKKIFLCLLFLLPSILYADDYSILVKAPDKINYTLPAETGATNAVLKITAGVVSWQADADSGGSPNLDNITINTNPAGQLQIGAGTSPAGKMIITSNTGLIYADTSAGGGLSYEEVMSIISIGQ